MLVQISEIVVFRTIVGPLLISIVPSSWKDLWYDTNLIIFTGAEVEGVRNDRGHSPGDLISDYVTKSYLQQFYQEQTAEEDHQNRGTPQLPAPPSGETTRPGEASTDDKRWKFNKKNCDIIFSI